MIDLLLVASLIVIFWVGAWGVIEHYIAMSKKPLFWYWTLLLGSILILYLNPPLLDHFV